MLGSSSLYRYPVPLVLGKVIRRPSSKNRSPYVADVEIEKDVVKKGKTKKRTREIETTEFMAHAPSLSLAGLVSAGETVMMMKNDGTSQKTQYKIEFALETRKDNKISVGANPMLVEKLAGLALEKRLIPDFPDYSTIEKQKTYGGSRVDFVLVHPDGSRTLVEVKNVPLADLDPNNVPEERKVRAKKEKEPLFVGEAEDYSPTALFPFGKKKPQTGVVSER